jgi:hypothetical protein
MASLFLLPWNLSFLPPTFPMSEPHTVSDPDQRKRELITFIQAYVCEVEAQNFIESLLNHPRGLAWARDHIIYKVIELYWHICPTEYTNPDRLFLDWLHRGVPPEYVCFLHETLHKHHHLVFPLPAPKFVVNLPERT